MFHMCDLWDPSSLLRSGACFILWLSISNSRGKDEKCRFSGRSQMTLKMRVSTTAKTTKVGPIQGRKKNGGRKENLEFSFLTIWAASKGLTRVVCYCCIKLIVCYSYICCS